MWYTQTGGENYKTASDSKITLHTKIITGNKKIGKMNRNATYNDWKWIFQKKMKMGNGSLLVMDIRREKTEKKYNIRQ